MAMAWDYAVITPKEYSDLTYFKSRDAGGNISDFTEQRKSNDDLPVNRIEITRSHTHKQDSQTWCCVIHFLQRAGGIHGTF